MQSVAAVIKTLTAGLKAAGISPYHVSLLDERHLRPVLMPELVGGSGPGRARPQNHHMRLRHAIAATHPLRGSGRALAIRMRGRDSTATMPVPREVRRTKP